MIRQVDVRKAFSKWKAAGLVSPAYDDASEAQLVDEFIEEFSFMDEDTLKYVSGRLANSLSWPTFALVRQTAQEFLDSNKKYEYIDYLADCSTNAYGAKESFEEFVHRIAKQFYPQQDEIWIKRNQFTLNFYGIAVHGCQNCNGHCLHNGHRYHLRLRKGTRQAVPYADLAICPKYKAPATSQRKFSLPPEPEHDREPNPRTDPEFTKQKQASTESTGKEIYVQQEFNFAET